MQKNQTKFEKEINVKTQELNEMKIHLDQFQKFFSKIINNLDII